MEQIAYFIEENDTLGPVKQELRSEGIFVQAVMSLDDFLPLYDEQNAGCLIFNLEQGCENGAKSQRFLHRKGIFSPVIILSYKSDVADAVASIQAGVFNYLVKPFPVPGLRQSVLDAVIADKERALKGQQLCIYKTRYNSLSPREREVLTLMDTGKTTKIIANELGIGDKTAETHRARVMLKMKTDSIPALIHMLHSVKSDRVFHCETCKTRKCHPKSSDTIMHGPLAATI